MKKVVVLFLLFCLTCNLVFAVDFDVSIDESIRKDYKVKESEETLPALPSVIPTVETYTPVVPAKTNLKATGKVCTIKSGTKIVLASQKSVNSGYRKGSKIPFVTQKDFKTKDGTTIPAGTIIKAVVADSHGPQITGNGALVELHFNEIYYNGVMSPLESKINKANYKRVYFNDIKGERRYWKNWSKAMKPGTKTFKATKKASNAISVIPVLNVVPVLIGSVVYTVNFVMSPIIMVFLKGGTLSLPTGTIFEIKVKDDIQISG